MLILTHCCRDWWVSAGHHIGSCGLCGQRPVLVEPFQYQEREGE